MKKVDENTLFREVTLRISSSLDIDQALTKTYEFLCEFIPMDSMGLYYSDEVKSVIYTVAEVKGPDRISTWSDSGQTSPLDDEIRRRIEKDQADGTVIRIHNRPHSLPASVLKRFPELSTRSAMMLLLRIQREFIGGMFITAKGFDRYTNEHAKMLESVKEPIAIAMINARRYLETLQLKNRIADDYQALSRDVEISAGAQVVGSEFGLRQVMELVRQVAPMTSPVLLLGETGTGKEVIANSIHLASPRRDAPIIRVSCGAIPESLLDSELFGHEKGAFTGAIQEKRGRFERANGGTIFLDEIAELTPASQVKLLRVLQEKQFERLGGSKTITVDVRVIAATHRNLQDMVHKGTFREDLWFRLNVFPIHLPPLRLRKCDIPSLVQHFIERKSREMNLSLPSGIADGAMEKLTAYDWPGNVRELQNVVERALILTQGRTLDFPQFSPTKAPVPAFLPVSIQTAETKTLSDINAEYIRQILVQTRGQVGGPGGAAERLGINPNTLRSRMRKLGIPFGRVKPN